MNECGGRSVWIYNLFSGFHEKQKHKKKKKWGNLHEPKMNFTIERKPESSMSFFLHRCVPVICMVGNLLEQARPFLQTYFLNMCDH